MISARMEQPGFSLHMRICPAPFAQYLVVMNFGEYPDPEIGRCEKAFLVPEHENGIIANVMLTLYMEVSVRATFSVFLCLLFHL